MSNLPKIEDDAEYQRLLKASIEADEAYDKAEKAAVAAQDDLDDYVTEWKEENPDDEDEEE
jgi:hypothetical protein